jgi:hypothetical protein
MGADANGRSLEYEIVRVLLHRGVAPAGRTEDDQLRDAPKFARCAAAVRRRHSNAAPRIADWIEGRVGSFRHVQVERMGDSDGGVADIRLLRDGGLLLSLSLKFNHDALKHPRPYSLAQACGFEKESPEDASHRAALDAATADFIRAAKRFECANFSDLPSRTKDMYGEVVAACARSVTGWVASDRARTSACLFDFLVSRGFHKVIVPKDEGDRISIEDFTEIPGPASLAAGADGSYLDLRFDNGWDVRMRLHSAAKAINLTGGQLSLKFDARKESGQVKVLRLEQAGGR